MAICPGTPFLPCGLCLNRDRIHPTPPLCTSGIRWGDRAIVDTPAISRVQAIRPQLLPHTPHSSPISIIHSVDLLPCTPTHRHCQYLRSTFCALSVALLAADLPASQVVPAVKNLPANAGDTGSRGSIPGWGRFLGEEMTPTPVFWPGESPGQRSLVGDRPWGCKGSDKAEHTYPPCCYSWPLWVLLYTLSRIIFHKCKLVAIPPTSNSPWHLRQKPIWLQSSRWFDLYMSFQHVALPHFILSTPAARQFFVLLMWRLCTFSPKSWPQHTIFPLLGTILPPFPSSLQFPSIVVWSLNLTLCDPVDCSSPGSSVLGIPQGRILEWVAIFISRRLPQPRDWTHFSCIGKWILDHWAPPGKPQFTANSPLQPQPNSALKKKPYSGISLAQCCHHHSLLFTTLGAFIMIAQCLFYPKDHLSCEEEPIWLHSYIAVPGMQWCSSEYLLNIWIY